MTRPDSARDRLTALLERGGVVKICGLRDPIRAAAAAGAGANLIGFIFAEARRQVTPEIARDCIEAARQARPARDVFAVGVFVDAASTEIAETVHVAGLDAVQLHGNETPEFLQQLDVPAIKAIRPRPGETAESVFRDIERFSTAPVPPVGILIDGFAEGAAGGTGARADWKLTAAIAARRDVLLGGGLNAENVGAAIEAVRPIGVDVSSGVETDGEKDVAHIEAFIRAAQVAFSASEPAPLCTARSVAAATSVCNHRLSSPIS